jgi:hypothetical protein
LNKILEIDIASKLRSCFCWNQNIISQGDFAKTIGMELGWLPPNRMDEH